MSRIAPLEVRQEASRLMQLPRMQARREFGDRVARAFIEREPWTRAQALNFNAFLATAVRELAEAQGVKHLWAA